MTSQAGNDTVAPTYQDPTKVSFDSKSEKYCITCGKSENVNRCARCKGAWYCDSNCQQADWPCHKILCAKYAKLNESEPIKNGYRAFLFRADSLEPELLVLPVTWRGERDFQPIRNLLHHEESKHGQYIESPGFISNMRLRMSYIYRGEIFLGIRFACRETFSMDGSLPNKSILASVKAVGKIPPHTWAGNIVVRRQHESGSGLRAGSVTMADFRHTIDWLAFYPKMTGEPWDPVRGSKVVLGPVPWSTDHFASIQGIQINGDQHIEDESERYKAVTVPASHPIRGIMSKPLGRISPISKLLDRPLRLVIRADQAHEVGANRPPPIYGPVKALLCKIENDTDAVLPILAHHALDGELPSIGQVLVVRADDKDLSADDVKAMSMCREALQGVMLASREDKRDMEAAMQRALGSITWDKYFLAFDKLGMPRPQRLVEEAAFVDMRGALDDVDDGLGDAYYYPWDEDEHDHESNDESDD
ncbi:hypothetical protein SLS64_002636 [Diaporthe eres]|uniref:MYND-type domain-containing protein n=1 Tax=Diaporthe eres TaxID=83184 RepID=A0ABR1PFP3_DIAER